MGQIELCAQNPISHKYVLMLPIALNQEGLQYSDYFPRELQELYSTVLIACKQPCMHSFNQYLLCTHSVPVPGLTAEDNKMIHSHFCSSCLRNPSTSTEVGVIARP